MTSRRKIAVAMSGGVDSAVAAALLVDRGEAAFGIMMRLWSAGPEMPNRCCSPDDMAVARRVAERLDLPFYVMDVRERFRRQVVQFFIDGYAQGLTPNPCMECNRSLRWRDLLHYARSLGATHLATGHYARLAQQNGRIRLLRARDRGKDQSYVLSALGQEQLAQAVFPLGELTKKEVRQAARQFELPMAERPESQDLCFVGGGDYREFLRMHGGLEPVPGPILDQAGRQLGTHRGLLDFTIGQRKGIGIPGPQPLYVLQKDTMRNALIVGPRHALGRSEFQLRRVNWLAGAPQHARPVQVQIRYHAPAVPAKVQACGQPDEARVILDQPLHDITAGQAAVFYDGDECLGCGTIQA